MFTFFSNFNVFVFIKCLCMILSVYYIIIWFSRKFLSNSVKICWKSVLSCHLIQFCIKVLLFSNRTHKETYYAHAPCTFWLYTKCVIIPFHGHHLMHQSIPLLYIRTCLKKKKGKSIYTLYVSCVIPHWKRWYIIY